MLGNAYSQGHAMTQKSGRAAESCWWQGCPPALEEPLLRGVSKGDGAAWSEQPQWDVRAR